MRRHGLFLGFFLVECGRYETIRFLFVHLRHIPRGDPLTAIRAKYRAVVLREVDGTFYDPVVVHLHKICLANFLVFCDEAFAIGAANIQDMAAPDFYAIRVLVYLHENTTLTEYI